MGRIWEKGRRGSGSEMRGEVLLVLSQGGGRGWAAYSQQSSFSETPFPVPKPAWSGGGGWRALSLGGPLEMGMRGDLAFSPLPKLGR